MSDSNSAVLQRAYELVEAGQADEARALVESVLEAEQTNPDAWWIYAHAVDDPVKARQALNEVMKLDPDYPGGNELVGVLDAQYPDAAEAAQNATPLLLLAAFGGHGEAPPSAGIWTPEAAPTPEPEAAEAEPSFVAQVPPAPEAMEQPAEKRGIIPWWWYVAVGIVALLVLALFAALLSSNRSGTTGSQDLASVAGQSTLDAGAQSAQETLSAAGQATLDLGVMATPEGGAEATGEASSTEAITSEPVAQLPSVVATLPLETFVTLTPVPPEGGPGGEAATEDVSALATSEPVLPTDAVAVETPVETAATREAPVAGSTDTVTLPSGIVVPQTVVIVVPAEALAQMVTGLSAVQTPPDSSLTTETTALGETLVASFCTQEGPQLRDLTRQVMDTVAAAAPVLAASTAAVGVRAVDCSTGETLRLIVVNREAATLYTQGEISREGFESQWVSL